MKTFPMFLKVAGRSIVIVGGGEQAAQKARLVLKTEAEILLVAEALDPELADLVATGRARHAVPDQAAFASAVLVFVATGCKGADMAWHALAKDAKALVNVVDNPDLCDAITPSIVDRDPVVVAIGTEGAAPILGRRLKTRFEEILHPRIGAFAALAGRLRGEVARRIPLEDRRPFWRWVFSEAPWAAFSSGAERDGAQMIKAAIQTGEFSVQTGARLSLIEARSASPDLLTLRAVNRLQEADVIFFDRQVDAALLELARRDAERRRVSLDVDHLARESGLVTEINDALRTGHRVVVLTPEPASILPLLEIPDEAPSEMIPGPNDLNESLT